MSRIQENRKNFAKQVALGLCNPIPETEDHRARETRRIGLRSAPLRAVVDRDVWLDFEQKRRRRDAETLVVEAGMRTPRLASPRHDRRTVPKQDAMWRVSKGLKASQ